MSERVIDYSFKAEILRDYPDLLRQQKRASIYDYASCQFEFNGVYNSVLNSKNKEYRPYSQLVKKCLEKGLIKHLHECEKINHAEYKRVNRLQKRICKMLTSGPCLFLTLTFTDSALTDTTAKKRRVAVSRFLKSTGCQYVANIDFGKKNHREHYHAVIQCDKIDGEYWRNNWGSIDFLKIRLKDLKSDTKKISKYTAKLSNHAIKETCCRGALIYSR